MIIAAINEYSKYMFMHFLQWSTYIVFKCVLCASVMEEKGLPF